ncbi:hypothetical protein LDENG_00185870 [Lucifuga dentata]|nr:hypothetical protein LDENG_00185870 [Lucifuga dentata]
MEGGVEESQAEEAAARRASPGGRGGDGCRPNRFINTRGMAVEHVYSAPRYHGRVAVNDSAQQEHSRTSCGGGGGGRVPPQLLNPASLLPCQAVMDPRLRAPPSLFLCSENILRAWGEVGVSDCCETTFIEGLATADASSSSAGAAASKEVLLFADGKFLDLSVEDAKIHTLSYDIDDDNEFQELEPISLHADPLQLPAGFCMSSQFVESPADLWQLLLKPTPPQSTACCGITASSRSHTVKITLLPCHRTPL